MKSQLKFGVNATIRSINAHTGEIKKETKVHNLVVNTGLEQVARVIGKLSTGFDCIAIGTNNTAPVNGDSALNTEVLRAIATVSYVTSYKVSFNYTFTVGSGVTHNIVEAGLFNQLTPSGSIMLNRLIFDTHVLDSDNDLQITITITVARA
jgi:hypothetical protein